MRFGAQPGSLTAPIASGKRNRWARGRLIRAVILMLTGVSAMAVGAAEPVRYPDVVPGNELRFPEDEGSHPRHRIEWWYVTGLLEDDQPQPLGFQVTFFRVRPGLGESNPSRFAPRQILFAHAAVADPRAGRLRHAQRAARAGFDLAYARTDVLDVRLDDWFLARGDGGYTTAVSGEDFSFELRFEPTRPPLLHGDAGYSRKGQDPLAASYYYSLPQLVTKGKVSIQGRARDVTGTAWLDHEWSSRIVEQAAVGWDWVGINLEDGGALMAFRMRGESGATQWASATLTSAEEGRRVFDPQAVEWEPLGRWRSPSTAAEYPVRWRLRVGEQRFTVEPLMDDAELDSRSSTGLIYWEGPVRLLREDGTQAGSGYLEMTGYADRVRF